jgi:DNA-binding transcriptional LysR family regulator
VIELRQLRYLIAAADAGSFTRAALQLNIKQATLSRHIGSIEKRLGLPLFERQPSGAVLTEDGQHYLAAVRRVAEDVAEINDWVRGRRLGEKGRLSIGFYTSLSAGNLRSALSAFADTHPGVDINHVERNRSRLRTGLNNGTIDIAFMLGDASYPDLAKRSLWSERVLVAFAAQHRLEECSPVRWSDLADEHFVLSRSDPGPEVGRIITSRIARADRAPSLSFADIHRETILNTVALGRHVTIVSEASTGNRLDGIRYREIEDRDGETRIAFSGYWREDNPNPVLRTFRDFMLRRYALPA